MSGRAKAKVQYCQHWEQQLDSNLFVTLPTAIAIPQVKYRNNIVEQDHRAVKRVTRPTLGCKSFEAAQCTLTGVELMHMIKKRQLVVEERDEGRTAAELFYALAA